MNDYNSLRNSVPAVAVDACNEGSLYIRNEIFVACVISPGYLSQSLVAKRINTTKEEYF